MSEKKSNGQVPEEGPDGKNLEQSEKKESFGGAEGTAVGDDHAAG